jgi:transposase
LVDASGIPLAWTLTGGNRNDVTQLVPLIERVPRVRGKVGRQRQRPKRVTADRGYDHDKYRRELRQRRITPEIARRQTAHGSGLGCARWVVERTFAWLHHFKRLLVRYTAATNPRSLPRDRLLPRLLQKTPAVIVIRVLNPAGGSTSVGTRTGPRVSRCYTHPRAAA